MKCKHFSKPVSDKVNQRGAACDFECPKGADIYCNIRKPSRTVRVKAWAYLGEEKGETKGWHCVPEEYDGTIPCTILIDRKYLGGKK